MRILEIKEKTGGIIYLTDERWHHISSEHPAVANRIEDIKETITTPLAIRESEYDSNVKFYYRYYKNLKSRAKYLMVAVKYLNGEGFIITSFYTDKLKGSK